MIRKDRNGRLARRDEIMNRVFSDSKDNLLKDLLNFLSHHKEFASMWFCGSRIDHSHCLGSESIGWEISTLPNDIDKASMPKYHPHQVEIMIPIQCSVCVETYTTHDGLNKTTIKQGECDYIAINRGYLKNNSRHMRKNIAYAGDDAYLKLSGKFLTFPYNNQLDVGESALFEMAQETAPFHIVLFGPRLSELRFPYYEFAPKKWTPG